MKGKAPNLKTETIDTNAYQIKGNLAPCTPLQRPRHGIDFKSYGRNNYQNHYQHEEKEQICNCKLDKDTQPGYLMELIYHQIHKTQTEVHLKTSKERIYAVIKSAIQQKKKEMATGF